MNSSIAGRANRAVDYLLPALAVVALTVTCVVSAYRLPFWFDELLSHYLVSDPSFSHMLAAQGDLITAAPPFYFIAAWPLAQVFGALELPLRLFSSIGISISLIITWRLLRQLYGNWSAAAAAVVCFFGSNYVLYQNLEGRNYGLFLAEVSAAVYLGVRIAGRRPIGWPWLAANALVHAALVTTHYFGCLYSGAILLAIAFCLRREPLELAKYCGCVVLGWLAFVPCVPAFIHHLEFNRPHSWIPDPTFAGLLKHFQYDLQTTIPAAIAVVALMAIAWLLSGMVATKSNAKSTAPDEGSIIRQREQQALALVMLNIFLMPVVMWLLALGGHGAFLGRYFLPDVLVGSFVFAWGMHWVWQRSATLRAADGPSWQGVSPSRVLQLLVVAVGVYYLIAPNVSLLRQLAKGEYKRFYLAAPQWKAPIKQAGVPLVVEDDLYFLTEYYYSSPDQPIASVADRSAAIDPQAPRTANNLDQTIAAFKRQYPQMPIFTMGELLHKYDKFIVVKSPNRGWFDAYIAGQPEFRCETLTPNPPDTKNSKAKFIFVRNLNSEVLGDRPAAERRQ